MVHDVDGDGSGAQTRAHELTRLKTLSLSSLSFIQDVSSSPGIVSSSSGILKAAKGVDFMNSEPPPLPLPSSCNDPWVSV